MSYFFEFLFQYISPYMSLTKVFSFPFYSITIFVRKVNLKKLCFHVINSSPCEANKKYSVTAIDD